MKEKGKEKLTSVPRATKRGRPGKTDKEATAFRLAGACLFLTYPKCGLTKEEAFSILEEKVKEKGRVLLEYLVAEEKHADGSDHLHAYLKMDSGWNNKDPHFWDLNDFHGNYQGARSPKAVLKYCQKEGKFLASEGLAEKTAMAGTPWKSSREAAKAGDIQGALAALESGNERALRDLTLYGPSITNNLRLLSPQQEHETARELASYPSLFDWDRGRHSLLLFGETNTGKTTLAESLLPRSLLTRHLDLLGNYDNLKYTGVILDDMSFAHLHDEAQLALLDLERTTQVHIRYKVAILPARTPRIFTTNKRPEEIFNMRNPAIARRCLVIRWMGWAAKPAFYDETNEFKSG